MSAKLYSKSFLHLGMLAVLRRISAALVVFASLRIGMIINGSPLNEMYQALLIIVTLLALILFRTPDTRHEHQGSKFWNTATAVGWSWAALFAILLLLGYATKTSSIYSRRLLLTWAAVTPVLIIVTQYLLDKYIARVKRSAGHSRRAVIVGVNKLSGLLAERIKSNPQRGLTLDGHFDDRGRDRLDEQRSYNLLGKLADLPGYVRDNSIDVIYVALPMRNVQRVMELLDELHDTTVSIYYVPDVFVFDLIQCRTDDIEGMPVVALCESPFHDSRGIVKRASDCVIALTILILTSPVLLAIAAAIKLTTPGSVIFKQRRYGLDGREIIVYKFRTMYVSEDSDTVVQAKRDDDRVTPVGAFLRRYSLDELPQFINVLQGTMSVVGPRPHAIAHNEEYRRLIKGYMIRHKVNPGVTGLAQVRGFRGETQTVDDMRNRIESDLEYLRDWSLNLDLKIIARTVAVMFLGNKAY
jgi:putative colanic acid biosynthesis UDP-glucose lipid carrier transferase